MSPFAVIKDFDVFEDTGSNRLDGSILLGIDQLDLEPAVEGLHHCIVPAIALTAHAGQAAARADQILQGAELNPAIRMELFQFHAPLSANAANRGTLSTPLPPWPY